MTTSTRRRARRIRDERAEQAYARADRRRQEIAAGTRTGPKLFTRKDREAVNRGRGGGRKQSYKHLGKRMAKREARRQAELAVRLAELRAGTAGTSVEILSVDFLGSSVPMIGHGTARLADGREGMWAFRFRYDRAFFEVGTPDEEYEDLVDDCWVAAAREDVTGHPYNGFLTGPEATAVIVDLATQAAAPEAGARFSERLSNTVRLLSGTGGDPEAPVLGTLG